MKNISVDPSGQRRVPRELPTKLLKLWRELHDFKQSVGMGLPMRSEMGSRDRFKKALQ